MSRADIGAGLFWLLVGAGVMASGWDLGLGALHDPGSGFLLFWVGAVMIGLSVAVMIGGLRAGPAAPVATGSRWVKVLAVLVALIAYGWLLERLGFVVTTALLLLFLFKAIEPQRWWVAVAGSVVTAVCAYVLFKVWLGAQLPAGWLEIG